MAHSTAHNPASRRKMSKNLNLNFSELNSRVFVFIRVHSRLAFLRVTPCLRVSVVRFGCGLPLWLNSYLFHLQCLSVFICVISGEVLTLSQPVFEFNRALRFFIAVFHDYRSIEGKA